MALPDDLSPDRDPEEEHPRRYVHGYHLLVLLHGFEERVSVAVVSANGFIYRCSCRVRRLKHTTDTGGVAGRMTL